MSSTELFPRGAFLTTISMLLASVASSTVSWVPGDEFVPGDFATENREGLESKVGDDDVIPYDGLGVVISGCSSGLELGDVFLGDI